MLSAVSHRPGPRLARKTIATNTGSSRICQLGANPYQTMSPTRMTKLMRKSTNATITAAAGAIRRGKYTLLIRLALLSMLLEESVSAVAKNVQGSIPANTKSAYGAVPSDGSLASLPNATVNTTMVRNG